MATTLTVLVTDGRSVVLGHVGDSRAYLLRAGELRQITTDHTYVQHLVETGRLSDQARATHPWRNVVLRSLDGDPEGSAPDITRLDVRIGDRLLLCSDGLTDLVDDARIAAVLRSEDPEEAAAELTAAGARRRRPRQHHLRRGRRGRRSARGRRRPAPRRGV